MQHLDEGTIHAWLDGALTPEEAAQADAHVKDCPQCQAAVAEARGFIAASSRILTALDDAPRGVIPVAPKRGVQPWVWRIAATVLVVATGTVLLVKDRGSETRSEMTNTVDSAALFKAPGAGPPVATLPEAAAAAADSTPGPRTTVQRVPAPAAIRPSASAGRAGGVTSAPIRATAKQDLRANNVETREPADEQRRDAAELKSDASAPAAAARVPIAPPAATGLRQVLGAVAGGNTETGPREVGTKRQLGRTQTFYEIAPGDTVVLEEQIPLQLQSVVVTGVGTARNAQTPPAPRTEKAAASVESQQKTAAVTALSAPVAPMQDAQVSDRHSISWLDPSTRHVVVLSGRHSQEELEAIRVQIQRLRPGQPKKNPE
jgi:anti-sigma factor RsiW